MLIEFTDGTINVDKKPIMKNPRINIAGNQQYRIKAILISQHDETPVDLIIYKLSFAPRLKTLSLEIRLEGIENHTRTNFDLKMSFNAVSKEISIDGIIGSKCVSIKTSNVSEIVNTLTKIISQYKK